MIAAADVRAAPPAPYLLLDAALAYADRGLYVLPVWWPTFDADGARCACGNTACTSIAKHPITANGQHDATLDERKIRAWWSEWPAANIGLALEPSGLVALDVDKPEGYATLAEIEREHGALVTARQRSGSGNLHVLARKPAQPVRGTYGGITLRGRNYIVAAPSLHASGGKYEWLASPWDVPPIELSPALVAKLARRVATAPRARTVATLDNATQVKRAKAWLAKAEPAVEGQHGEAKLFAVCCKLVHGFRLGDSDALAAILDAYNPRCVPPWGDDEIDEVRRKIREARATCDNPSAFAVEDRPPPRGNRASAGTATAAPTPGADAPTHPGRTPEGGYRMTEIGNALRFADAHHGGWRYVTPWGAWLRWDGTRWLRDDTGAAREAAKQTIAAIYREVMAAAERNAARATGALVEMTSGEQSAADYAENLAKHARSSSKRAAIDAMLALAQSDPRIAIAPAALDADPWALTVANGTTDLHTGELRPHRAADLITHLAPVAYDPTARAPEWERFLARVLPDERTRAFVQRLAGYALTGDVREQVSAFFLGGGANGKSVFLDTMLALLGDYGLRAAPDLVLASHNDRHPTEIADLDGRRFVVCSEIEQGRQWAESTIKRLNGDTTIKARRMREDFYEFRATHKLIVAANTRPTVRGTDNGIWRRMRLVPWTVTIPTNEQDLTLAERLIATERAGIFAWAVRGCLAWQRDGLGSSPEIDVATAGYRAEQDLLGRWIDDRCTLGASAWCACATLYDSYTKWCEAEGVAPWSRQTVIERLSERTGIAKSKRNHGRLRVLTGISPRTDGGAP